MKLGGPKEQNLTAIWNVSGLPNGIDKDSIHSDRQPWFKWPSGLAEIRPVSDQSSILARPST